ncbi:MAG: SDR family oxidoreductase [Byssovorax sp.]
MPHPGYDAVVLVTGYPSTYARAMIARILRAEPRSLVYVLVPPSVTTPPGIDLPDEERARIVPIAGDVTSIDLGLSGAEIRQLSREIDRVHHVGHVGSVGVDKRVAHNVNVVGTAEVLEVSRALAHLQCLVFHSTANVSGDRVGVVYEDDLDRGQTFRSEVDETRKRAEVLVRRAMQEVPIAVVRPTILVGETGPDANEALEGLYLLILLVLAAPAELPIPLAGKGESPLNIVPLDYVVQAAHAIGRHPGAPGRTFHLADPSPLSVRSVLELIGRTGGRAAGRSHVPSSLAKALLRTPGIERVIRNPRAFVEQLTSAVRYDTRNTDHVLGGTDVVCPPFESYVGSLVEVVEAHIRGGTVVRPEDEDSEVNDPLA